MAKACFLKLSEEQILSVEEIALGKSAAYVIATKETIPLAENKIVHDRLHVRKIATRAVDKIRRGEHKKLKSEGDDRLTHSRYVWLKSQERLTENQRALFDNKYIQQLETDKAWAYTEMLRDPWRHDQNVSATEYFNDWYKRSHPYQTGATEDRRTFDQKATGPVCQLPHAPDHQRGCCRNE